MLLETGSRIVLVELYVLKDVSVLLNKNGNQEELISNE